LRTVLDLLNERPRRGWSRSPVADVLAAHAGAIKILHTLRPVIVVMAALGGVMCLRIEMHFRQPNRPSDRIDLRILVRSQLCQNRTHVFACSSTVHVSGYTIQH
jgi:hypothetical protein